MAERGLVRGVPEEACDPYILFASARLQDY